MIFDRFSVHCIEYQMQIRVCFRFFTTSREIRKRKRQTIWLISLMLVTWVLKVIISSSKTMLWESSRPRFALAFNTEGFSLLISKLDQHDWWEKQGTNRNRQNATTQTTQLVISNAWLWSADLKIVILFIGIHLSHCLLWEFVNKSSPYITFLFVTCCAYFKTAWISCNDR